MATDLKNNEKNVPKNLSETKTAAEISLISAVESYGFFGAYPSVKEALRNGADVTKEALTLAINNTDYPALGKIFREQPDSHKLLDIDHLMAALKTGCFTTFMHVMKYVTPNQECFLQAIEIDSKTCSVNRVKSILERSNFKPGPEDIKAAYEKGNDAIKDYVKNLNISEPSESPQYSGM